MKQTTKVRLLRRIYSSNVTPDSSPASSGARRLFPSLSSLAAALGARAGGVFSAGQASLMKCTVVVVIDYLLLSLQYLLVIALCAIVERRNFSHLSSVQQRREEVPNETETTAEECWKVEKVFLNGSCVDCVEGTAFDTSTNKCEDVSPKPQDNNPDKGQETEKQLSKAAIAGIVVACVIIVLGAIVAALVIRRRFNNNRTRLRDFNEVPIPTINHTVESMRTRRSTTRTQAVAQNEPNSERSKKEDIWQDEDNSFSQYG
ncbi:MAG: hypothetical protein MHMPM18_000865 [Marteilia pararefringens]